MSTRGLGGGEVALLFLHIGAGRTEQSPGPVRGGCLTGHNRYKCSAGSLCQPRFPGENQRRRTDSPLLLSSLSKSTPESRQSLLCRSDPRASYGPGGAGAGAQGEQTEPRPCLASSCRTERQLLMTSGGPFDGEVTRMKREKKKTPAVNLKAAGKSASPCQHLA